MNPQPGCNAYSANTSATNIGRAGASAMEDEATLRLRRIDEFEEDGIASEDPYQSGAALMLADLFRDAIGVEQEIKCAGGTAMERLESSRPGINTLLRVTREAVRCAELIIVAESAPHRRRKH